MSATQPNTKAVTLRNFRVEYHAPTKPEHTFEPYCAILADAPEFGNPTVRVFDVPDPDGSQQAVAAFACKAMNAHAVLLGACKSALRALEDNLAPGCMDADAKEGLRPAIALAEGGKSAQMSVKQITVNQCTCERCGHKWISEIVPVRCARCRSNYWNKPKRQLKSEVNEQKRR